MNSTFMAYGVSNEILRRPTWHGDRQRTLIDSDTTPLTGIDFKPHQDLARRQVYGIADRATWVNRDVYDLPAPADNFI